MKTPDNLIECHVDPRVLDLAARLQPLFMEWAEVSLNPEEIFDIILMPHDISSSNHRVRIVGGIEDGGGTIKSLAHKIDNTQPAPEGVQ